MTNREYLYVQLAENIKKKIINGTYGIGSRIPSEREMAEVYGITRVTVRRALDLLVKEKVLVASVGKGTFVAKMPDIEKRINLGEGSSSRLVSDIRSGGMNPSKIVIDMQWLKNDLKCFPNEEHIFQLTRLMLVDDKPYAIQISNLPYSKFEGIERYDFKEGSLYDYMDNYGHLPIRISSELTIVDMPKEFKKYFNIKKKKKVFHFEYMGRDKEGELVEYTESYNLPEYTEYKFTIKRF